jgi:hypothetical protein
MRSLRSAASCAVAGGLVSLAALATIAASGTDHVAAAAAAPATAHAAGTDAPPAVYPSIVNLRLERTEAALQRATTAIDQGNGALASTELTAASTNATQAWAAAKYVIETAPPPPPPGDGIASLEGGVGSTYAAPEDTAIAVLSLQHEIVVTGLSLVDAADATSLPSVRTLVRNAVNDRDAAIEYIHSIAPPPVASEGRVEASASDEPVASTWDTLMPGVVPVLGDELQVIAGAQAAATATATPADPLYRRIRVRDILTRDTVNTYWPPLPATDD